MNLKVEFCSHVQLGGFLASIVSHLRNNGWNADQYFTVSESDYRTNASKFARIWLRIRMFAIFPAKLALHVLRARPGTVLVVTSNPFFAPLVVRALASRKVKVIHLVYDLYPDALEYAGKIGPNSFAKRILDRIQREMLRQCDANVFLGQHLLDHVRKRFGEPNNSVIIPVGADDNAFIAPLSEKSGAAEPLRLLYCGNMGHMHDTSTLSAALVKLCPNARDPGLEFSFHASGAAYPGFCASINASQPSFVSLEGYLKAEQWAKAMSEADIAIVTMKNGSERVVMPSKTYSAMQAAQAILAIAPLDSDLATLVREHNCGWVIEPGDVEGLASLLESLPNRRAELLKMQENAQNASTEHYSASVVAEQWAALFKSDILRS